MFPIRHAKEPLCKGLETHLAIDSLQPLGELRDICCLIKLTQDGRSQERGLVLVLVLKITGPALFRLQETPDFCRAPCGHHNLP